MSIQKQGFSLMSIYKFQSIKCDEISCTYINIPQAKKKKKKKKKEKKAGKLAALVEIA